MSQAAIVIMRWEENKKTKIPRKTILVNKKPALTKSQISNLLYLLHITIISLHHHPPDVASPPLFHHENKKLSSFILRTPYIPCTHYPIHTIQYSKEFSPSKYNPKIFVHSLKTPKNGLLPKVKTKYPGMSKSEFYVKIKQCAHQKLFKQRKKSSVDRYERKKKLNIKLFHYFLVFLQG